MIQPEICTAIQNKLIVEFMYNGKRRIVEPHIIGRCNGKIQVLGYQIEGQSSSGALPQWRRFEVPIITRFHITDQCFDGPRPTISGYHTSWDTIIEIVK